MITYTGRWVFPVAGPPHERGLVTVEGATITAVEPDGTRAADVDLGNAAIVPGLVNAHTHLDLSGAYGVTPPTDAAHFTDWLESVIAFRRNHDTLEMYGDLRHGIQDSIRFGVTLIGDIAHRGISVLLLQGAKLHSTIFRELIGLRQLRVTDEEQAWINAEFNCGVEQTNERLFIGKSWNCCTGDSPHAPYSASKWLLQAPAARPRQIHLAESPAELELLQTRSGPFIPFLQKLNVYDGAEFIEDWQLCIDANIGEHPVAFIHGNYLPLTIRFAANHTLVVCPRTHAAFGHPRHPFPHFFRQGVRIALGTDSLASNPDLDILAEAVVLRQHYPEVPAHDVLRMITINAAEALGWGETCGTLASGKPADFTVIPLPNVDTADPHDLLFQADLTQPRRTLFNGEWR